MRSPSIALITSATERRRAFSVPQLPFTATDPATFLPPRPHYFGQTGCPACSTHQTHKLIPCQHNICYPHFVRGEASKSSHQSLCAQCHQIVVGVIEIPPEDDPVDDPPLSVVSPILNTSPVRVSSTSPVEKVRQRANTSPTKMLPSGHWGHPGFQRQTPVPPQSGFVGLPQRAIAPQQAHMPGPSYPNQQQFGFEQPPYHYPAQQVPAQQFYPQQFPPQQYHPQQSAVQPFPAYPQGRPIQHQGFAAHQPSHNFAVQPYGFPGQTTGVNMPTQPHPGYNSSRAHDPRNMRTNAGPGSVQTPAGLADPFVEASGYATSEDTSAVATPDQSSDSSYVVVKGAAKKLTEQEKAFAAKTAADIRSGRYDSPATPRGTNAGVYRRGGMGGVSGQRGSPGGRRGTTGNAVGNWQPHQPAQYPQYPPMPAPAPVQPLARQTFVGPDIVPNPPFFGKLADGVRPVADEAFDYIPFTEMYRRSHPTKIGVVKVCNFPYDATKNEIIAAIGRQARIVSQPAGTSFNAIHIIMERPTGKTGDGYIELESHAEAVNIVKGYESRCMNGRQPKMGARSISIELSSHEELMEQMFPRARCVTWKDNVPTVHQTDEPFNSGFLGFLTGEEMVMVQKYAENPVRSPFATRSQNRIYECLISTLHKYPWFADSYATLGERKLLYDVTHACIRTLTVAITRNGNPISLNRQLLQELVCAVVTCGGFTHYQQAHIAGLLTSSGFGEILGTVPFTFLAHVGNFWPFEILAKRSEVGIAHLMFYIKLLREGTEGGSPEQTDDPAANPFGRIVIDYGPDKDKLTLKDAAIKEWNAIEEIMRRVLPAATSQKQLQGAEGHQNEGHGNKQESSGIERSHKEQMRQRAASTPALYGPEIFEFE